MLTHRRQTAREVRRQVVLEVVCLQKAGLDHVVEGELADGDEDGPARRPVGAVEQLAEALLASHAQQAVDRVLVAGTERERGSKAYFVRRNGSPGATMQRRRSILLYSANTDGSS